MTGRVFHYTIGDYLPAICHAGEIRQATAWVPGSERPVVWCTTRDDWEPTANKGGVDEHGRYRGLTREETEIHGGGLVRIEVDPEAVPVRWHDFVIHSGVKRNIAKALERSARKQGSNVRDWRCSFDPIPLDNWVGVERWNGSEWESLHFYVETCGELFAVDDFEGLEA